MTCNMWRFSKVRQPLRLVQSQRSTRLRSTGYLTNAFILCLDHNVNATAKLPPILELFRSPKKTYLPPRFLPWGSQHTSGFTLRPRTVSPQVAPISRSTDSASLDALGLHGQRSSWFCRSRLIGHNVYLCNGSNDLRHQAALLNPKCNQQPGVCFIGKPMVAGGHG